MYERNCERLRHLKVGVSRSVDRIVQPSWNVIPKERANPLGIIPENPGNNAVP
jgi:hypothetical protein